MSTTTEIKSECVPSVACTHPKNGFSERMVVGLLEKMPVGGLRLEHADGRVRHFGAPGALVTARVKVRFAR